MTYKVEVIRKNEFKVSNWSGGTTTEIAIYPKDALYSERNFLWRISSAKVEAEESVFTSLPNINRIIMIIDGEFVLKHEGHHECLLKPFEQDSFSGSWITKSYGRVTDFNLMTNRECKGELEAVHIANDNVKKIEINNKANGFSKLTQAIYCVNGNINIRIPSNEIFTISKGDAILITSKDTQKNQYFSIYNEDAIESDIIYACIWY
ncbi:HutD family protein [Abyssisolibacter fermentans]|uniref:HutD/Ves family protein n=1 Tax=Abyssisolibacter fermentans TaxID=1766203 RepID=UPI00082A4C6D|nr:HutD family protein [Abyssisolibacter fermentans]